MWLTTDWDYSVIMTKGKHQKGRKEATLISIFLLSVHDLSWRSPSKMTQANQSATKNLCFHYFIYKIWRNVQCLTGWKQYKEGNRNESGKFPLYTPTCKSSTCASVRKVFFSCKDMILRVRVTTLVTCFWIQDISWVYSCSFSWAHAQCTSRLVTCSR